MQNGDYWLQEIDNPHNSPNRFNWFCLAYDYSHQIWIWYYFVFSSNGISKTLNAYISKLILSHLSTSSTTPSISKPLFTHVYTCISECPPGVTMLWLDHIRVGTVKFPKKLTLNPPPRQKKIFAWGMHTEMISGLFLWGSVLLSGELQKYAKKVPILTTLIAQMEFYFVFGFQCQSRSQDLDQLLRHGPVTPPPRTLFFFRLLGFKTVSGPRVSSPTYRTFTFSVAYTNLTDMTLPTLSSNLPTCWILLQTVQRWAYQ